MTPLKRHWMEIYTPLVEHMKLQVRMNIKSRTVEIRVRLTHTHTTIAAAMESLTWMNGE